MPQRKFFVATGNLSFDFELFIGARVEKRRADDFLKPPAHEPIATTKPSLQQRLALSE
jgi:hypothetical protein